MKSLALVILSLVVISVVFSVSVLAMHPHDVTTTTNSDNDSLPMTSFPKNGSFYGPSKETEIQIKQDYLNYILLERVPEATFDDVFIFEYYGSFSGCYVVRMSDRFSGYAAVITYETIDHITITYSDTNKAVAWKDGAIYSITDAYDRGLLTPDDIESISQKCPLFWWVEEKQIRQDYVDAFVKTRNAKPDKVWIDRNYGRNHGGCAVLMMWYEKEDATAEIWSESVDGVLFKYNNGRGIITWKDGKFYGLQEAFDKGYLYKDEIVQIAEYHELAYPDLYVY